MAPVKPFPSLLDLSTEVLTTRLKFAFKKHRGYEYYLDEVKSYVDVLPVATMDSLSSELVNIKTDPVTELADLAIFKLQILSNARSQKLSIIHEHFDNECYVFHFIYEKKILKCLGRMENLRELTITFGCKDESLEVIGKVCRKLRKLTVTETFKFR